MWHGLYVSIQGSRRVQELENGDNGARLVHAGSQAGAPCGPIAHNHTGSRRCATCICRCREAQQQMQGSWTSSASCMQAPLAPLPSVHALQCFHSHAAHAKLAGTSRHTQPYILFPKESQALPHTQHLSPLSYPVSHPTPPSLSPALPAPQAAAPTHLEELPPLLVGREGARLRVGEEEEGHRGLLLPR